MATNLRYPRSYQLEIYKLAKKYNVIACLPTGTGKTYIACLLINDHLHEVHTPFTSGGKRIFFLVPQKVLVGQQAREIRENTSIGPDDVKELSGDLDVDSWRLKKWEEVLDKHKIFVMTHQILENVIVNGFLPVQQIALIVFDEIHHASQKSKGKQTTHVYYRILVDLKLRLKDIPEDSHPRLLGLTASVINTKTDLRDIPERIRELEILFLDGKCVTVSDQEVEKYKTNAKTCMWIVDAKNDSFNESLNEVVDRLLQLLDQAISRFRQQIRQMRSTQNHVVPIDAEEIEKSLKCMTVILKGMGIWMSQEIAGLYAKELRDTGRDVQDYNPLYATYLNGMADYFDKFKEIVQGMMSGMDEKEKLLHLSNIRPRRLLVILENFYPGDGFRGIVFVRQRLEAMVLASWIKKVSQTVSGLKFVKAGHLVGFCNRPSFVSKPVESAKKKQQAALEAFQTGKINLLVCTSVLEEGLDVAECNCVIRYELPQVFRSWQQSKGRARADKAYFFLMVDRETLNKTVIDCSEFKEIAFAIQRQGNIEKRLRDIEMGYELPEHFHGVDPDEEILKTMHVKCEETGAVITHDRAISLVYQYLEQISVNCLLYPNDESFWEDNGCYFQVTLPLNTVIQEPVRGIIMSNKRAAKQAAYLEICRLLKEKGVLDNHLNLIRKKDQALIAVKTLKLNLPEVPDVNPKPGTRKSRSIQVKAVNSLLVDNEQNNTWFLYYIDLSVSCSKIKTGILVPNKLPLDSMNNSFNIFKKTCLVEVTFKFMQEVSLTEEELQSLNDFHEYIFITGLMFDPQDITCNFFSSTWQVFVVPVDLVENRINFSYVQELKRRRGDDSFRRPSDPNDFFDFMVTFNYRASSYPVKVKNICHDKNSWSPFDDIQRANNYVEYYQEVYDIDIQRKNDPLLECEYAERLATLRPRVGDTPYVHLIPELVDRLPLEASVFEDLSCVPTVLQRLDQLLKAESFRRRFYRDFGIGNEVVPPSYFGKLKFPIIKTVPKKKPQDDDQTLTLSETIQEDVKKFVNEDRDSDWSLDSEDEEDTSCILDTTTGDEEEESIVDNMEMEEGANIPDSVHYENNNPNEEFLPDDKTRISKVDTDDKSKVSYMPKSGFEVDPMKAIAMYSLQRGTNDESEIYGDEFLRKFKSEIPTRKNQVKTLNITLPQQTDCDDLFQLCTDATEMLMKIKMVDYTFEAQGDQKELLKGSTTEEEAFAVVKSFIKDSTATLYSEYGLSPSLFIEVFTTSSARDSVNSERLETLGDAFLKWSVSEFLFDKTVEMPELTEGHLTSLKGQLVSNYNLCRLSREHLFNEELTVTEFAPRFNWMPPGFVLNQDPNIEQTPERQARQLKRTTQLVNDKAIADSMEALIGAIILSRGVKDAAKFVTKLGIDVGFDGKVSGKHWLPRPISFSFTTDQREQLMILYKKSNLSHCEKIINYVFKEKAFLVKAITHPSNFENRVTGGNQKLEFLGDAVLDYLITRFLFENKKKRKTNRNQHVVEYFNPGQLTDLRSALTNNAFLGTILIKYRLHVHLACLSPETWRRISLFAKDYLNASQARSIVTVGSYIVIPKAPVDSDDESQVESSINNSSFIEVPKILGDLFESILAAIYLDSERDMDVVWKVLYGLIKEEIAAYLVKTPKNPIRMIYENDREAMFSTPTEKKMKGNDEVVEKTINLCFKKQTFIGRGRNQKLAKIDAAIQGLRSFNLFKQ